MNYYNEIKNELINNEINRKVKNYSINKSDLNAYYNVGKILSEAGKHYDEGIVKEYSKKLKIELGKSYSVRLLYRMLKYYDFISKGKLPTLSAKLSWSHYDEILRFNDVNKIIYYINMSEQQNLSVRQLRQKIKNNEYERLPIETKNKLIDKEEPKINDLVKNNMITIEEGNKLLGLTEVTGEGVIVAILDTGVNYEHPDLADHLWDGGAEYPNHRCGTV